MIDACDCGLIHVHVGALSLRFEPSTFSALADTILEALARRELVMRHRFPNLGVRGHGEHTS